MAYGLTTSTHPARADRLCSSESAVNLYDRYLMPLLIDAGCGLKDFQALRALLLPQANGAVLEIGIGTGRNQAF